MTSAGSSPDYVGHYATTNRGCSSRWRNLTEGHDDLAAVDFESSLTGLTDLPEMSYTVSDNLISLSDRTLKEHFAPLNFQYVLNAPTSPATKITEESLTYLNQGQLYELKLKQLLGSSSWPRDKLVKTYCKIGFHERRLRFSEQENVEKWKNLRPGERIIEIDAPHSYGISDLRVDPHNVNLVEFAWDPAKEAGLFIRINSISTEFTIKKHGGEKGVSFRIQIDTYAQWEAARLLHCASSQIKVFKPKGAERKLKTDRDKIDKLPESEKERYQPSYECTILSTMPLECAMNLPPKRMEHTSPPLRLSSFMERSSPPAVSTPAAFMEPESPNSVSSIAASPAAAVARTPPTAPIVLLSVPVTATAVPVATSAFGTVAPGHVPSSLSSPQQLQPPPPPPPVGSVAAPGAILQSASAGAVTQWLHDNRFGHCARMFQNFTGADMLRLTRDELIQICGVADGIRLNNNLQQRQTRPRLSLYIAAAQPSGNELPVFQALYLSRASVAELVEKLTGMFGVSPEVVSDVLVLGQSGTRVLVTDAVVENMADGVQYATEVTPSGQPEKYRILLRPIVA